MKNFKITITDEEGNITFETSISTLQKEWDNDPVFGDEGVKVSVKDLAEAVGDELSTKYYSK
jgi:hypothetical protein|tara:strand:+ start:4147 stop:4332 length:186 start_codon:yes stop_codon:yes gene_type:complete